MRVDPRFLDAAERLVVLALYLFLFVRVLHSFLTNSAPILLVLILSEGLIVFFLILRRRTTNISLKPRDWLIAFGGTAAPLLVDPAGGVVLVPGLVSLVLMLAGFFLQIAAKATLGRRFGLVAANRGVTKGGPYGLLRHPMYAGYSLMHIGFFLGHAGVWNAAVYLAAILLQIVRLMAEEALLSEDAEYRAFCERVRYRLIPGVF